MPGKLIIGLCFVNNNIGLETFAGYKTNAGYNKLDKNRIKKTLKFSYK